MTILSIIISIYVLTNIFLFWKILFQPLRHGYRFNLNNQKPKIKLPGFYNIADEALFFWYPKLKPLLPQIISEFEKVCLGSPQQERLFNTAYNNELYRLNKEWKTHNIIGFGYKTSDHFPTVYQIMKKVPNLFNCCISRLKAHTQIEKHYGENSSYIRCHIGLRVPAGLPDLAMVVNGEKRAWEQGELMAFCDNNEHWAFNHSNEDRYTLMFDVMLPQYAWYTKEYCAFMIAISLTQALVPGKGQQTGVPLTDLSALPGRILYIICQPLIPILYFYFRFICKKRPEIFNILRKRGYAVNF